MCEKILSNPPPVKKPDFELVLDKRPKFEVTIEKKKPDPPHFYITFIADSERFV